jgi:hypothetical protein
VALGRERTIPTERPPHNETKIVFLLERKERTPGLPANISLSHTVEKTLWPESVSKLYLPSDHRLLSELVQTFADRGCHVIIVTDP